MEELITWALQNNRGALALSLFILVVLWRRYVKLEEGAMEMVKRAHTREVEIAKESANVAKEVLPVLRAVDERGERLEQAIRDVQNAVGYRES